MKRLYRNLPLNTNISNIENTITDIILWALDVARERQIDLADYNNQIASNPVIFTTAPTSSSDLKGSEKIGDMAFGTDSGTEYVYFVVDNGGTLQWQRVALATF